MCMSSCSDTGNMQLLYNSLGSYLVHVLFSQFVFFPINSPEWTFRKPCYTAAVRYKRVPNCSVYII